MDYTGKIISKNPPQPTQASASGVWTLDEAAAAVRNNNWPIVGVPNPISKSLRFNVSDSAYLNRTPAIASSRTTWTWSAWIKRSAFTGSNSQYLFSVFDYSPNNLQTGVRFTTAETIQFWMYTSASGYTGEKVTSAVYRDMSAWYHIVATLDTTNATANDRMRLYINGVQVTAFSVSTNPAQNTEGQVNRAFRHVLGAFYDPVYNASPLDGFNGYMTEVNFIDGQALTPSSFGQTNPNTGVWEPIRYTGTYGTNGFYLNFKDSSSVPALGYDYSGNANNWTPNNLSVTAGAGNDSLTDVPTSWTAYTVDNVDSGAIARGNYSTLNPLAGSTTGTVTYSNGNLDVLLNRTSQECWAVGSITLPTSGKWYFEFVGTATNSGTQSYFLVGLSASTISRSSQDALNGRFIKFSNGEKVNNGTASAYGSAYSLNDVCGVAIDMDNYKMWFSKNGTYFNSGDPVAGTNAAFTDLNVSVPWYIWIGSNGNNTNTGSINFGQRAFSYSAPAGYKSLCTTNLPTPVIGATSTTQADDYFNTVTYTGNNTTNVITVGFQPDLTWVKRRDSGNSHNWADVIRGATNGLASNSTAAAYTITGFDSFISTGFQLAADTTSQVNANGGTYVSWNWKAGGTGVSNTTGSISSTVSANSDAGFSVVTFTATGANSTVGHGCKVNGVATAPSMFILKRRDSTGAWAVYHSAIGNTQYLILSATDAATTDSVYWNNTSPTSTVFSLGSIWPNAATYVGYCFAPVAGYSAFGSFTGNASTDGPFVYTGFRPRYILWKNASAVTSWGIWDTSRSPYNVANTLLFPNDSSGDYSDAAYNIDILSNGFKFRTSNSSLNGNGNTMIYAAFAESPFKYALAR